MRKIIALLFLLLLSRALSLTTKPTAADSPNFPTNEKAKIGNRNSQFSKFLPYLEIAPLGESAELLKVTYTLEKLPISLAKPTAPPDLVSKADGLLRLIHSGSLSEAHLVGAKVQDDRAKYLTLIYSSSKADY